MIGKSPKRNSAGYILNTDGSRHIENKWGTIAYEDTPGRTLFGDLELGHIILRKYGHQKDICLMKRYMM